MPLSSARWTQAIAWSFSTPPDVVSQEPKAISETSIPLSPSLRYFMNYLLHLRERYRIDRSAQLPLKAFASIIHFKPSAWCSTCKVQPQNTFWGTYHARYASAVLDRHQASRPP